MFTYVTIIGLLIGSFLNVCIYRIPRGESISFPPSHCTNCENRIKWYDLIPVISYFLLKGKCRYCGEKISLRYPIIELITGSLFGALYINLGFNLDFIKFAILICFLIVIGIIDFDTTDVYSSITYSGIAVGIVFIVINYFQGNNILQYVIGGVIGAGLILLIVLITHGMGSGDIEICGLCGLFLGTRLTGIMLFVSFILGGTIGIILLLTKKKSRKDYIPFGPYIAMASIIAIFFGNRILMWYFGFFTV